MNRRLSTVVLILMITAAIGLASISSTHGSTSPKITLTPRPPTPPNLTLNPASAEPGAQVSVSGLNYLGTSCALSSSPPGLFTSSSCLILAGNLTGDFRVDLSAAAEHYAVTATTNVASETASALFTVTAPLVPTLTLNPTSGYSGKTIMVSGLHYLGTTCTLSAYPSSLFVSSQSTCSITAGNLTGSFTVAYGAALTSFQVTATTNFSSDTPPPATFTVTGSPPVAQAIAGSSPLQALFRVLLLPLVGIVHVTAWVFTALGAGDLASIMAFAVAAVLSILIYIVSPIFVVLLVVREVRKRGRGGGVSQ